jgi:hypothetical protein
MRNIQQLIVALIVTMLAACGGGGTLDSGGGTGGNNTPVYTVVVGLTNSAGGASTALAKATPLTVTATLTATNNGVIAGRLVQFSLNNNDLGTLGNTAGTAITNANGVATITLLAGSSSGAGTVTATYETASGNAAFNSAGDGSAGGSTTPEYTVSVGLTNSAGNASTALAQATPLTVTATLSATNNGVISGRLVQFSLSNNNLATLGNTAGTAITNASGVATISLLAGSSSGAGTVTATYETASGNAAFNSAGDGGSTVEVTIGSVSLIADTLLLGSGASDKVELSALVRDANNVVLANVPVTFSTDSGELVQIDNVTGANGVAKATLTTQTDKNNRKVKVIARVQQKSSELTLTVVGTRIEIAAPDSVVLADTTTIDLFLRDANGAGIQGVDIDVVSSLGNTLSDTSPETTGNAGKASFTYTAVNSGSDTLTVSALGATNTAKINISADAFSFVDNTSGAVVEVPLNVAQQLEVEWLVNNTPNVSKTVTFNTTRGVIADSAANLANNVSSQAVTDASGKAQAFVRSQFAGLATISATGGNGVDAVSANKVIEFVATSPTKVETQAFPAQVGPGESSAVRAIVRDANNNPVKNQVVVFTLDNAAGGVISTGSAVTNSQGIASTVFTADAATGAGANGLNLVVKAALQSNNSISDAADIAVGKRTLFFRFGTGNAIQKPNASTYAKEFSIIVTDSSGNPVANQALNVAVVSTNYRKGFWVVSPPAPEAFKLWVPNVTASCVSEDANLNGILDAGEDVNADGILTPGNVATAPRTVTANDSGIATFLVTYPQDYAAWIDVRLQVSGIAAGTENITYREYSLPVSAEDVTTETSPPPSNPNGVNANCAVSG